jgi:hypothetical protein
LQDERGKAKEETMAVRTIGIVGNEAARKKLAAISKKPIAIVGNAATKAKLIELAKLPGGSGNVSLKGNLVQQGGQVVLVLDDVGIRKR